ncbi:hypothetical protein OC846_002607 [Tilletia horrida]|uniref:Uncharacterized protein n=1 Tax=Tilletia horrida TaxID=155126 RepID=A0AAN6GR50_9BASI|nr:hypothetical protein OC845_002878 [Tilletia horrida]KAK0553235.1 hypothetical protein OC846_002607 [Tilletia horrida]KAK0565281.1 hypothetical protein OC861_003828 [Tilletia horrida]
MPSQASTADIYVACLYSQGDGMPLWNPSPIRTGAIGYVRDGSFYTLYNIEDGPPTDLHPAADPTLIGRRRSTPANHGLAAAALAANTLSPRIASDGRSESVSSGGATPVEPRQGQRLSEPTIESSGTAPPSLRRSVSPNRAGRRGSIMGSMRRGSGQTVGAAAATAASPPPSSSLSDPVTSPAEEYHAAVSPGNTGSRTPPATTMDVAAVSGSPRLRDRDLPPEPPLPAQVEFEDLRRFDAGPRSSSTYTCLGFSAGANVPGAPAGGMWSFKSSGGDGALLIPRDPTEREQLRHVGNLKIYVKTHLRWIAYRYGISEDIEPDDIVLVFSQDRTSDWACAVSRNTAKGASVEFEVFSIGKASVWGEWRTAMTASQRGPHRGGMPAFNPNFAMGPLGSGMHAASTAPSASGPPSQKPGISFSAAGLTASFSPTLDAEVKMDTSGDSNGADGVDAQGDVSMQVTAGVSAVATNHAGGREPGSPRAPQSTQYGSQMPSPVYASPSMHGWPLINPHPADQAIVIKRITMKHRLPFLPASIRASAGPRPDPSREPDKEDGARALKMSSADYGAASSSSLNSHPRSRSDGQLLASKSNPPFDPLNWLHEYLLSRAPSARASIASDAECAFLLRRAIRSDASLLRPDISEAGRARFRDALFRAADRLGHVCVDEDDVAIFELQEERSHAALKSAVSTSTPMKATVSAPGVSISRSMATPPTSCKTSVYAFSPEDQVRRVSSPKRPSFPLSASLPSLSRVAQASF